VAQDWRDERIAELEAELPDAKRHQVTEVPPIQPAVTKFRRHEVECPCCEHKTRDLVLSTSVLACAP
jgi:hypothetical protein